MTNFWEMIIWAIIHLHFYEMLHLMPQTVIEAVAAAEDIDTENSPGR